MAGIACGREASAAAQWLLFYPTGNILLLDDKDLRNYEMVLRVNNFSTENAADFPATTLGSQLFNTISTAVTNLSGHIAARSSGKSSARAGTSSKSAAREALRTDMEMIRRTARAMAQTIRGLDEKFRIPRNLTDQDLLGTARAFLADATPLKSDFLRFAMPPDFLDELAAHIEDFETALNAQQTGKGQKIAAGAAFDDDLGDALSAVRQLDAIVRNTYHDNPAKLAEWESARHVERASRAKAAKPTPAPQNKES